VNAGAKRDSSGTVTRHSVAPSGPEFDAAAMDLTVDLTGAPDSDEDMDSLEAAEAKAIDGPSIEDAPEPDSGNGASAFSNWDANNGLTIVETVPEGDLDNDDQWPEGQWPEGDGLAEDLADDVQVDLSTRQSSAPTDTGEKYDSGLQELVIDTNNPGQELEIDTNDPGRADFVISVGALGNASGTPLDGSQNMSFGERTVNEKRAIDGNNNNKGGREYEGMLVCSGSESSTSYATPSGFDPSDPDVIADLMPRPPAADPRSPITSMIGFNEQVAVVEYKPNGSPPGGVASTSTGNLGGGANSPSSSLPGSDALRQHANTGGSPNSKGERMSNPKVPRNRNLNFTKTNAKNGKNKNGGNKNGTRQFGNKGGKKKFYVPPEQYKSMTAEQFQAAEAKYYAQYGNQTPVPSSNYCQANQMQTVLQLLAMTDSQSQDLQRATTQINTIQQNFPGLNLANAASLATSQQQVATVQPVTGNSQVNFLTQLLVLNASTQQALLVLPLGTYLLLPLSLLLTLISRTHAHATLMRPSVLFLESNICWIHLKWNFQTCLCTMSPQLLGLKFLQSPKTAMGL